MKNNFFFRFVTFYSITSILLQSLLPFFSVLSRPVSAQDATPTATVTESPTPTSTVEPTIEPTVEPTLEPTAALTIEPTTIIDQELTPTVEPSIAPTGEILDGISTSVTPVVTSTPTTSVTPMVELTASPTAALALPDEIIIIEVIKQDGSYADPALMPATWTDKMDYHPYETVKIGGKNFIPGATYTVIIASQDLDLEKVTFTGTVIAQTDGTFTYEDEIGEYRANYLVEIKDETGVVVAKTTFTDSRWVTSATVNGGSTTTVTLGAAVSASVTTLTWSGLLDPNNNWRSTSYTIEGYSPVCINTTNHDNSGTNNVVLSITAPSVIGTFDVVFKAYSDNSCAVGGISIPYTLSNAIVTQDITPPVITLLGNSTQTVEAGTTYIEAGATVSDNIDSGLVAVIDASTVATSIIGTYYVTYNVSDLSGNDAIEVVRTVNVVDTTAPTVPTGGLPHNISIPTNNFDFTWNASSDISSITYVFQSSLNPVQVGGVLTTGLWTSGVLPTNMIHSSGAPDGVWSWQVRAVDSFGNSSAWSTIWNVTLDTVAPSMPSGLLFQSQDRSQSFACGDSLPMQVAIPNWDDITGDSTFSHYEYTSFHPSGAIGLNESILYVSELNNSWMPPADGAYGYAVRSVDFAGNKSEWALSAKTLAGSCQIIYDTVAPVISIVNPTTLPATSKTITASTSDGVLTMSETGSSICNDTLTFIPYASKLYSSESDNGIKICYRAEDIAGNVSFSLSNAIGGIDLTAPDVAITAPTVSITNTNVAIRGTVTDVNPHHYWLVVQNASGTTVAGPGTVNYATSFTDRLLFTWNVASVPNGVYRIKLEARDAAGNKDAGSVTSQLITIDKVLPTVSSVSSDGVVYNSASSSPTIKITFNENMSVAPTISIYPVPAAQTVDNCSDADAKTFCFTYTLANEEQTRTIYISDAQDLAGNTMTLNNTHTFIVDRVAPRFMSTTAFSGWHTSNQIARFVYTDANLRGDYTDPTCTISTEGIGQTCSISPTVCDQYNNCNTDVQESNGADIDTTIPASIITTLDNPGSNSVVYSNSWDGLIEGTATDAISGVASIELSIKNNLDKYWNGTDWSSSSEVFVTAIGTNTWNYQIPLPIEGSYTINSHAIDTATNRESTYTLTVILDKTIPEVSISLNPTVGDAANGWYKTQPEVTLTATDDVLTDSIEYQWNSQTGTWSEYSAQFKPGSEGARVLYYRAKDKAGNYSAIGIKNINWNKTDLKNGPLNVNVSPNPTSESTSKVKWEAATSDTIGIDKYEVQWKLKSGGDKTYTVSVGSGVREYTVDNLTEGIWEVKVTAFDASGNNKSASADLTVDRTGPTAPTLSIFGTAVGSVSLSWSKVEGANNYIIWYGTTSGNYQYGAKVGDTQSYTVQGLGAGSYYFIVRAVDPSGNQSANSNEVSTGAIAGAPGVAEGTPAQGFAEEVLGANTLSPTPIPTGVVLGAGEENIKKINWWWLLLLLIPPSMWYGYKKWKKSRISE